MDKVDLIHEILKTQAGDLKEIKKDLARHVRRTDIAEDRLENEIQMREQVDKHLEQKIELNNDLIKEDRLHFDGYLKQFENLLIVPKMLKILIAIMSTIGITGGAITVILKLYGML